MAGAKEDPEEWVSLKGMTMSDQKEMSGDELKTALKKRGQEVVGDDAALRKKLVDHVNSWPLFADIVDDSYSYGCSMGWTYLIQHSRDGNVEKVKKMLKCPLVKATINQIDRNGMTALYLAAYRGHLEIVEILVAAGAKIDKATKFYNITALIIACERGHTAIAEVLLKAGADPVKNGYGGTCFHNACSMGRLETIKMLMTPVPWPEAWRPAMLAMCRGARLMRGSSPPKGVGILWGPEILKLVAKFLRPKSMQGDLKYWVTPEQMAHTTTQGDDRLEMSWISIDQKGETAMDLARKKGHRDIVRAIQAYTRDVKAKPKGQAEEIKA